MATTKAPPHARARTITSNTGAVAASRNRLGLVEAQAVLNAQGTVEATYAAMQMQPTIDAYTRFITKWYADQNQ